MEKVVSKTFRVILVVLKSLINNWFSLFGLKIYFLTNQESPNSLLAMKNLLCKKSKLVIFDVGAFDGRLAQTYSKNFPKSVVYAFEPYKPSFEKIKKIRNNNIKPFNFGFSDTKGNKVLYVNASEATNSLVELSSSASETWKNTSLHANGSVSCEFKTLDEFIFQKNITKIDFLKIDVQGAEHHVLKGAKKCLENKIIKNIQLEVIVGKTYQQQKSASYYFKFFENANYELYSMTDFVFGKNNQLVQFDIIFSQKR